MIGFFLVMKAELVRSWIVMRRYWFRTITGLVIGYSMLVAMIYGIVYSGASMEDTLNKNFDDPAAATNFILGFIIGMFAFSVVGMFTQGLQGMARTGVLEQLCMSPHGLITNFLARSVVAALATICSSGLMVWLVTISVGGTLHFDPLAVLPVLILTYVNLLGFGFMMGGLVLVFKQVGQVAMIIRMVLFGIAIYAREEILEQGAIIAAFMHALPITDAAICLKYVLIRNQGLAEGAGYSGLPPVFYHSSFFYLLISCVIWTTLGIGLFKAMENWSRARGTLGAY